jgi:hypothetical protein
MVQDNYFITKACYVERQRKKSTTAHVLWQQQKTPQHLRPFTSISVTVSQYYVYLSNSTVTEQHRTGDAEQVLLPGTEKRQACQRTRGGAVQRV